MARLNRVSARVEAHGECGPAELETILGRRQNAVIICNAEGAEVDLLDPEKLQDLITASILVEMHDFICPGVTDTIKQRFDSTQEVTEIWQEPRLRSNFPWKTIWAMLLSSSHLDWAVSEWRLVRMNWLWLRPAV